MKLYDRSPCELNWNQLCVFFLLYNDTLCWNNKGVKSLCISSESCILNKTTVLRSAFDKSSPCLPCHNYTVLLFEISGTTLTWHDIILISRQVRTGTDSIPMSVLGLCWIAKQFNFCQESRKTTEDGTEKVGNRIILLSGTTTSLHPSHGCKVLAPSNTSVPFFHIYVNNS